MQAGKMDGKVGCVTGHTHTHTAAVHAVQYILANGGQTRQQKRLRDDVSKHGDKEIISTAGG